MPPFMHAYTAQAYALMRIVTGFLFLWHGTQKLFGVPMPPPQVPSFVIAIAGPIELIGGTLVMIGLFAGWAAFLCSGLMAAAYWMAHGTQALLPIQNMGGTRGPVLLHVLVHLVSRVWHLERGRGPRESLALILRRYLNRAGLNAQMGLTLYPFPC